MQRYGIAQSDAPRMPDMVRIKWKGWFTMPELVLIHDIEFFAG